MKKENDLNDYALYVDSENMTFFYLKENQIKEDELENRYFIDENNDIQGIAEYVPCVSNANTDEEGNLLPDSDLRDEYINKGYRELFPLEEEE